MLVPKVAKHFAALPSTNTALLADLSTGAPPPHGAVYVTDAQTAGRGQGSNHWHSSPGANLTLSLLLRPDRLSVDHLPALTQCVALAVADTVAGYVSPEDVRVKWPNDVYVGDQKIAGILLQNGLRGTQVQWAVAGIGLNVNEQKFPGELAGKATSLRLLGGVEVALAQVQGQLFAALTLWYNYLAAADYAALDRAYHRRLYRLGETVGFEVTATGERFLGRVEGVDDTGRLVLLIGERRQAFSLRELKWR